jgi:preprotein translocase subunit SecG
MSTLLNLLLLVQILSALGMIGLILVQHGKGADMGAAFGSGSSGSLFGATGGANFLSRTTSVLAAVFFACTLALAYFGNLRPVESGSVLEKAGVTAPPAVSDSIPGASTTPAVPVAPAAGSNAIPAPVQPAAPANSAAPATPANPAPGK